MPHKRTNQGGEEEARAGGNFRRGDGALERQREAAVAFREEDVARREDLAPDLKADLMLQSRSTNAKGASDGHQPLRPPTISPTTTRRRLRVF